jgi:hypothetical protein
MVIRNPILTAPYRPADPPMCSVSTPMVFDCKVAPRARLGAQLAQTLNSLALRKRLASLVPDHRNRGRADKGGRVIAEDAGGAVWVQGFNHSEGRLRHAQFIGSRNDKRPREVRRESTEAIRSASRRFSRLRAFSLVLFCLNTRSNELMAGVSQAYTVP